VHMWYGIVLSRHSRVAVSLFGKGSWLIPGLLAGISS
jgi:hypothetical protein